ncbi:hypothetical protein H0H93_004879 [Arthromyces matolae]|nr:hypothetical protein H0H93_004879 [Arthromyces matolae]
MSIYASSLKSASYSSASSSTVYSHVSSWGTIATPHPSTPHSAPLTLPACCPTPPYASGPQAHPALQRGYNLLLPPRDAPTRALYATEPATYPPTRSLTLRILVNPTTPFPGGSNALDIPLSSQTTTPLTLLDVLSTLARALQRPISRTELGTLSQEQYDKLSQI